MNNLEVLKTNQFVTTLDIADMLGTDHWQVLRKLEGRESNGKHIKGIIEILTDNQVVVSDFFTESSYVDESGKSNKYYNVTKLGCEFLANKYTGEKGIVFTARYVKAFNEMESVVSTGIELNTTNIELENRISKMEKQLALLQGTPIRNDWYYSNKTTIDFIVKNFNIPHKTLYHKLLEGVNLMCNIEEYNEKYKEIYGVYPKYPIDVFNTDEIIENVAKRQLDNLQQYYYEKKSGVPKVDLRDILEEEVDIFTRSW